MQNSSDGGQMEGKYLWIWLGLHCNRKWDIRLSQRCHIYLLADIYLVTFGIIWFCLPMILGQIMIFITLHCSWYTVRCQEIKWLANCGVEYHPAATAASTIGFWLSFGVKEFVCCTEIGNGCHRMWLNIHSQRTDYRGGSRSIGWWYPKSSSYHCCYY